VLGANEARRVLLGLSGLDAHWQLIIASMLAQTGNPSDAIVAVEKVLALPNLPSIDMYNALKVGGGMYMTASPPNLPKAIDLYRRLVKEVPNDFEALNNLAYLLLEPGPTNNPKEAVGYSERVLDLTRRMNATDALPLVMDTHGLALICSGKPEEGVALLRDALQKKQFPEGFYHMAEGYLKLQPPKLLEAERAMLDAKQSQEDAQRLGTKPDPDLKSKIQAGLDRIKVLKK
jgi:tetratricopeptide (TPR) repeat protein